MQTKDTVINKLVAELAELKTKVNNLETFMTCQDFMEITPRQKELLEKQYGIMQAYKTVLIQRVYNLRWEKAGDEAKEARKQQEESDAEKYVSHILEKQPCDVPMKHGEKNCQDCDAYLGYGFCTGDAQHHEVDRTGEKKCYHNKINRQEA